MDPRRQLIADTALAVIGRDGIRALTHHRIDDDAGLARGSTSYYCRKRVDMLRAALLRLYELDEADLRAAAERAGPEPTPARVRGAVAELIYEWLSGDARQRSIARIELFMAASHEPELQPLLAEQFAGIRATAVSMATDRRPEGLQRFAASFMLADGLMLGVLREGRPAPSRADIEALLATLDG
jgi:DNA-binding transcriptional regulator YbjK